MGNNESLEITIKNIKPVGLMDLTNSMLCFNKLYVRFLNSSGIEFDSSKPTLYINEIKKGSIILELASYVQSLIPIAERIETIIRFAEYFKKCSDYLLGRSEEKVNLSEPEIKEISAVYDVTASDHGSNIIFNVSGNGNTFSFNYTGTESGAIQNGARKQIEALKATTLLPVSKQLMTFYQARFDSDYNKGTKAIIESVTPKPLKVTFSDDVLKYSMMSNHESFRGKAWQDLAYFVDAEVQTIQGQPKAYKITRFYESEIIDPNE